MDCTRCQGNGELESLLSDKERHRMEEHSKDSVRDGFWPYTCPVCGGSGNLEE